jgi:hypothetical protein
MHTLIGSEGDSTGELGVLRRPSGSASRCHSCRPKAVSRVCGDGVTVLGIDQGQADEDSANGYRGWYLRSGVGKKSLG